ncbi:hypothetical protein ACOSP6_04865 [Tenacibaculum sp. MEBiC06402]|uniref:hypothetical protein n=1 Tax=unclassified Tenacibaculum TaxID=2635139 RepID=UPI003B99FEC4
MLVQITGYTQEIEGVNFIEEIKNYNVSDLFVMNKTEPIGYIGEKYQRFFIHFISVIKNPRNNLEYFVYGKTKVKDNICSFQGILKITTCTYILETDVPNIKQGSLVGEYAFYEDTKEKGSGLLKGKFFTDFIINEKGVLVYDNLMSSADGYQNNQFEGIWISYKSKSSKKCNWGDYRIPDSGDLDVGTAEFAPNPYYHKFGWLNYTNAYLDYSNDQIRKNALNREKEHWWKNQ